MSVVVKRRDKNVSSGCKVKSHLVNCEYADTYLIKIHGLHNVADLVKGFSHNDVRFNIYNLLNVRFITPFLKSLKTVLYFSKMSQA